MFYTNVAGFYVPRMEPLPGIDDEMAPVLRVPKFWKVVNQGDGPMFVRREKVDPNGLLCIPKWLTRIGNDNDIKSYFDKKIRSPFNDLRTGRIIRRRLDSIKHNRVEGTMIVPAMYAQEYDQFFKVSSELSDDRADQYCAYGFLWFFHRTNELFWFQPVTGEKRNWGNTYQAIWYDPYEISIDRLEGITDSPYARQITLFAMEAFKNMI